MRNAFIRRVLFSHNSLKQYQNKVGILRDIIIRVPTLYTSSSFIYIIMKTKTIHVACILHSIMFHITT